MSCLARRPVSWWDLRAGRSKALLATGRAAQPYLSRLLDDTRAVHYETLKWRTPSRGDGYRLCDFGYRYTCLILGLEPEYDSAPEKRGLRTAFKTFPAPAN